MSDSDEDVVAAMGASDDDSEDEDTAFARMSLKSDTVEPASARARHHSGEESKANSNMSSSELFLDDVL